jgi:serine/threonine protein kinase
MQPDPSKKTGPNDSKEMHHDYSNDIHPYDPNETYLEDYFDLQNFLGRGNIGEVRKAVNKLTGQIFSLKFFLKK